MFFSPPLAFHRGRLPCTGCSSRSFKVMAEPLLSRGARLHPSCSPGLGIGMGRGVSLLPPLRSMMGDCGRQGWELNFQMAMFERQVRKGYPVSSPA